MLNPNSLAFFFLDAGTSIETVTVSGAAGSNNFFATLKVEVEQQIIIGVYCEFI